MGNLGEGDVVPANGGHNRRGDFEMARVLSRYQNFEAEGAGGRVIIGKSSMKDACESGTQVAARLQANGGSDAQDFARDRHAVADITLVRLGLAGRSGMQFRYRRHGWLWRHSHRGRKWRYGRVE